jgi:hypothetical protein
VRAEVAPVESACTKEIKGRSKGEVAVIAICPVAGADGVDVGLCPVA